MSDKSILEKALLQVQHLEEAVKQNAKGILESTMKQELKDLLSENEEKEVEVDETELPTEEIPNDVSEQSEDEDNEKVEDAESEESEEGEESPESDFGDDEESMDGEDSEDGFDSFDSEEGEEEDSEDDVLDMTNSSDEEVLKVFKSMKPEDGIVVKKDGKDVSLEMDNDEYIIKLDGEEETEDSFDTTSLDENEEELGTEDSTTDEIELDEEDEFVWFGDDEESSETEDGETPENEEGEESPEMDTNEASRTLANDVRVPANQGMKFKAGRHEMNEEITRLKEQNKEYRKTILAIKEKLNEVAVFNANLAYSTRLFTEHSTTKSEKLDILKRYDSVSNLQESKKLFNTIKVELETKKPIVSESMNDKLTKTKVSSSTEMLSESKVYENTQFSRIKELMKFNNK